MSADHPSETIDWEAFQAEIDAIVADQRRHPERDDDTTTDEVMAGLEAFVPPET
jgi:hypothetical protein